MGMVRGLYHHPLIFPMCFVHGPLSPQAGEDIGRRDSAAAPHDAQRIGLAHALPVIVIILIILAVWYVAAIPMNRVVAEPKFPPGAGIADIIRISWSLDRPVLPAPHQVITELWNTVFLVAPDKPRSLVYHGWVTLSSTLLGFINGTILGIALAAAIVQMKTMRQSLMPWLIASQTIPILAIAPMVIVVLGLDRLHRAGAQIDHLDLSLLLSRRDRHGEGPDVAGSDAARPDAHL